MRELFATITIISTFILFSCLTGNTVKTTDLDKFLVGDKTFIVHLPINDTVVQYCFYRNKNDNLFVLEIDGKPDGTYELLTIVHGAVIIKNMWGFFSFHFDGKGRLGGIEQHIKPNAKFNIKEQNVSFIL